MTIDEKLDLLIAEMQTSKTEMRSLKTDVQSLKTDVQSLNTDVQILTEKVTSLELSLENETNRNIKLIAEGHLDLTRKLDDALKVENEKELLLIRVNIIENDIRKIKDKLSHIA